MARSQTLKQRLVSHLDHVFHGDQPLPKNPTLKQLQEWHHTAHRRYLTHTHAANHLADGSWGRVVDISLYPPKSPMAANRQDRNWTLQISKHENEYIVQFIALAGTFAGDVEGAKKAANLILGYQTEWVPNGWGYVLKETPTNAV